MASNDKMEKIAPDSLVACISGLLATIGRIPHASTSQDMAAAIAMLGDVEKSIRKLKVTWTQELVQMARQRPLV